MAFISKPRKDYTPGGARRAKNYAHGLFSKMQGNPLIAGFIRISITSTGGFPRSFFGVLLGEYPRRVYLASDFRVFLLQRFQWTRLFFEWCLSLSVLLSNIDKFWAMALGGGLLL